MMEELELHIENVKPNWAWINTDTIMLCCKERRFMIRYINLYNESSYSSCEYSVIDGESFSEKIIKGNNIGSLVEYIGAGINILTFQISVSVLLALLFKPIYGIIAAAILAVFKIVRWCLSLKVDNLFCFGFAVTYFERDNVFVEISNCN